MASTIGTACHLTCALDAPTYDPKLRTNTWCHGGEHLWSIMGAHFERRRRSEMAEEQYPWRTEF